MKDRLTVEDMRAALEKMGRDMVASAERLRELDAAAGDGDLGVTMTVGWKAVQSALPELGQGDVGSLVAQAGMTFNRAAASTFGVLLATAMMRAGRELRGLQEVGLAELAQAVEAALQGVRERGKAEVGHKTMLDAMAPAVEALKEAVAKEQSLSAGLEVAAQAAQRGAENTAGKKPRYGRAAWLGERATQVQDPGATAVALMLRSLAEFVRG